MLHFGWWKTCLSQSRPLLLAAWIGILGSQWAVAADPKDDPYHGFKVGLQSYSLREFDEDTALQMTNKLGLHYWEAFRNHVPVGTVPSYVAEQKAKLDKAGVTLASFGVVHFDDNETKAREIFDFAKAMGLVAISADPNKDDKTMSMLEKLVEEYQIPIAIHNHGPGHRYDKVADVLAVVNGRHALIGACVDTGHYLRSDEDPVEVIQKLGPRVFGVHLKDVRTIHSPEEKEKLMKELPKYRADQLAKEGKIFTILGEGELNTVGVMRALRDLKYDRNISVEYEENPKNPLSDLELSLVTLQNALNYLDDKEEGFVSLFNGKNLDGWKINERPESWKVENGEIVALGDRSHVFYVGDLAPFKNFELRVDVKAEPNSNGGIYYHTKFQDQGWPAAGFETQVNNSYVKDPRKTGSLYAVLDVHEQLIPDNTWWTQDITVQGKHVIIKVDGRTVVDYTEPETYEPKDKKFERRFGEGTFALQAHDPGSIVHFKNIRVKKLPD
ncbi:family 16 glycoside hydrolase [Planctomicrobium piriforme]|uniref:Sugar phosphate isomerase/epimerase n=1 Tax=Planctomicrobium piriforme TaxID=1576369 RepID=A0A1I3C4S2_9PLAN|nr:family 16 glycoside hydrolase [Planctomicrobium piriforme]SFH69169.1 Sugar phosphate isomerase/epimerase [Planctomicrobium piriforme]